VAERRPPNARYQRRFGNPGSLSNLPSESNFADEAVRRTYEAGNELQAVLLADDLVRQIEEVQRGGKMPPPLQYRRSRAGDPGE
jgi:hypothetical protein